MDLKNKRVLVLGLGISGLSTVKALYKLGANIVISDSKSKEELKEFFSNIKEIKVEEHLGTNNIDLNTIDLIIKSPGIKMTSPILVEAGKQNIEIITDIELAYRISPTDKLIAITGTNGKTTTTALVGEILKKAHYNCIVAGNIGVGILWDMVKANKEDVFAIETSSFQLESTVFFKPKVSLITNITPDHIDWHGSYKEYINAKKKVFKNQDKNDYTVLNYDDEILKSMKDDITSNIIWFSIAEKLEEGLYIEDDFVVFSYNGEKEKIINIKDIKIIGKHNLQNALSAVAIAWAMGVGFDTIIEVLKEFPGVEHRNEYVDEINGIKFYNDSKGTNVDSTIKAVEALEKNIILIAGGYDKQVEFDELIKVFEGRVKELVLLGETKEKIKDAAIKYGFENIHMVDTMKEAVIVSYDLAMESDNILLSPACASWGMYNNFEERGKDFKNAVYGLKED